MSLRLSCLRSVREAILTRCILLSSYGATAPANRQPAQPLHYFSILPARNGLQISISAVKLFPAQTCAGVGEKKCITALLRPVYVGNTDSNTVWFRSNTVWFRSNTVWFRSHTPSCSSSKSLRLCPLLPWIDSVLCLLFVWRMRKIVLLCVSRI